jgi:MFS family permease
MSEKLWTKNFTIIIFGSLVSFLGTAVSNFAFSLLVYDKTNSPFLFSLMMVIGILPQIFVPIVAGAYLDRRSRRVVIFTIDFISSGIFLVITLLLKLNFFNYWVYLFIMFIIGCLNAFYVVAYDSYYPVLIPKGKFSKAYAISSLLYPIAATIMTPVAGIAYEYVGLVPLFAFSTLTLFVTAVIETRMDAPEPHLLLSEAELKNKPKVSHFQQYRDDIKFGLQYLKKEKGLLTITTYFFFTMMTGAVLGVLFLPYLKKSVLPFEVSFFSKSIPITSTILFSILMGMNTFGRIIGGTIHYKFKVPVKAKFAVALTVYITITVLDGTFLFLPYPVMILFQTLSGMFAVTSFNIRISATQNYVPDTVRGRFNGIFYIIIIAGELIGQLAAGALGEVFDARWLVLFSMVLNMVAIFLIMVRGRRHVKQIYNCDI